MPRRFEQERLGKHCGWKRCSTLIDAHFISASVAVGAKVASAGPVAIRSLHVQGTVRGALSASSRVSMRLSLSSLSLSYESA